MTDPSTKLRAFFTAMMIDDRRRRKELRLRRSRRRNQRLRRVRRKVMQSGWRWW